MGVVLDGWLVLVHPDLAPDGGAAQVRLEVVGQQLVGDLASGRKVDRVSGRVTRPHAGRLAVVADLALGSRDRTELALGDDAAGRAHVLEVELVLR